MCSSDLAISLKQRGNVLSVGNLVIMSFGIRKKKGKKLRLWRRDMAYLGNHFTSNQKKYQVILNIYVISIDEMFQRLQDMRGLFLNCDDLWLIWLGVSWVW